MLIRTASAFFLIKLLDQLGYTLYIIGGGTKKRERERERERAGRLSLNNVRERIKLRNVNERK